MPLQNLLLAISRLLPLDLRLLLGTHLLFLVALVVLAYFLLPTCMIQTM